MKYAHVPEATLIIGSWSSHCNACGRSCSLSEKTHDTILGYGPENGTPGCGIEWTHVTSEYAGKRSEDATRDCRPDLEYIHLFPEYQSK